VYSSAEKKKRSYLPGCCHFVLTSPLDCPSKHFNNIKPDGHETPNHTHKHMSGVDDWSGEN